MEDELLHKKKRKRGGSVTGVSSRPRLDKAARGGACKTGGGVSAHMRKEAKAKGHTLPGTDKFPINSLKDLSNAKHDIGRTNEPRSKVVSYIDRRAKELGGKPVGG